MAMIRVWWRKARVLLIDNKLILEFFLALAAMYISLQVFQISKYQAKLSERQTDMMNHQEELSYRQTEMMREQTDQADKQADLTRRQFESLNDPVLQDVSCIDTLSLLNLGSDIENIIHVVTVAAYYDLQKHKVNHFEYFVEDNKPVANSLKSGQKFNKEFSGFAVNTNNPKPNAFAVVFRYSRSADKKLFYKIVCFIKTTQGEEHYVPTVFTNPGTRIAPPDEFITPELCKDLREDLRDICIQCYDLPANTI